MQRDYEVAFAHGDCTSVPAVQGLHAEFGVSAKLTYYYACVLKANYGVKAGMCLAIASPLQCVE